MYKWNMSYDDGAMPIIEEQLRLMQFDLHQPFFLCLFVIILCHALLKRYVAHKCIFSLSRH